MADPTVQKVAHQEKDQVGDPEALLPSGLNGQIRCLDLGCAKGTFSYLLKARGGTWVAPTSIFQTLRPQRRSSVRVSAVWITDVPFADQSWT